MAVSELLAQRYELVRVVGRGAMCDVYETHDRVLGATVALKRFRDPSPRTLLRLKSEFRALAGIHHPGLVPLFDLVVTADVAFFTLELIAGEALTEYAFRQSVPERAAVFRRVAAALDALHGHGKLHRDIKPSNILVDRDGQPHILDFGFVDIDSSQSPSGTLAYMSPELFEGMPASSASDWYAFGVLLYEALTGEVPGVRKEVAEMLVRRRTRRFPRPRAAAPAVPATLDDLVWGLLDPDPRTRFGYADVLDACPLESAELPLARAALPRALFGRAEEILTLGRCLESSLLGGPTVVTVEGASGTGKSALVRSFLDSRNPSDVTVLESAPRPQEFVALCAIDAIMDGIVRLLRSLPPSSRFAIQSQITPALARAFPVLLSLDEELLEAPRPGEDALAGRREAELAFAALIRALCTWKPTILWIDDVQWADHESFAFLRSAIDQGSGSRLLVILGRRPVPVAWVEHEAWLDSAEHIPVRPLEGEGARALLELSAGRQPMSKAALDRALTEARGNAFLLEFLGRYAGRKGDVHGGIDVTSALRASLAELEDDARTLFECVALTQQPLPLACIGRILDDRSALRGHAATLASKGLVSIDASELVKPYHDALREPALTTLDSAAGSARHALIAKALEDFRAPPEWSIPHLEGCGRTAEAAERCVSAGEAAAARYAFGTASDYYKRAVRSESFMGARRARLLSALADNLALAGNGPEAASNYEAAAITLERERSAGAALAVRHKRAVSLLRSGEIAGGRSALESTLRGVGEYLPTRAVSVALSSVIEAIRLGLVRRGSWAEHDREPNPEDLLRLEALWTSATSLSMYDPLPANVLTLRFVRQAIVAGSARWVLRALALEAAFLSALGKRYRARAESTLAELRQRRSDSEWSYERAWVAATEGSAAWLAGDPERCRVWTARARDMFLEVPATGAYEFALLDAFRLPALVLTGHIESALRTAEETLAVARGRGDRFAALPCQHGHITLAYLTLDNGDLAEAKAAEAWQTSEHARSPMGAYHQMWSRATVALFRNDGARARAIVRAGWRTLRRSGMLFIEAVAGDVRYLWARCALTAAKEVTGRARHNLLREAQSQARCLSFSALRSGRPLAATIEAQLAIFRGEKHEADRLGAAAVGALEAAGLAPDAGALRRRLARQAPETNDRIYVSV